VLTVLTTTDLNRLPPDQLGREVKYGCLLSIGHWLCLCLCLHLTKNENNRYRGLDDVGASKEESLIVRSCSMGTVFGPSPERPGHLTYVRSDCKRLTCPRCGPKRAFRYRQAIGVHAEEHRLTRMMTLTLDPKKCPVDDSVAYLRKCFSKFRVSLLRRLGHSVSFIAVVELQKSGMAHLHVLIGVYLEQRWIKEAWQRIGGGQIVDIRTVDVHRIKRYLSKYLTKDLLLSVPAKKKRISTSRDIRLFEKRTQPGWIWSKRLLGHHQSVLLLLGRTLEDMVRDDDGTLRVFTVNFSYCWDELLRTWRGTTTAHFESLPSMTIE